MNAVFADTVGLLAAWNRQDRWHKAAKTALRKADQSNFILVTTTLCSS